MGKKKKKQGGYTHGDGMYNQTRNNEIAEHLEAYVDAVETLFILEGKKESDVKDAVKTVRKACKNLREGRPDKVFDEDRFYELMNDESSW